MKIRNLLFFLLALSFVFNAAYTPLHAEGSAIVDVEKDYYTRKKRIRVTDGVGKGRSKEIALQNAIRDARAKALERSTSSFRHYLTKSKDGEFADSSVASEVHAKVIDREKIISVNYDHGIDFSPYYVAVADVIVTVSFLDLDFFAQEIMKTAEAACIRSMVISGWGQIYNKNYITGISMSMVTYGSIGYGYRRELAYERAQKDYNQASTPEEAEQAYSIMREHKDVARTMYIIGTTTWAYSVWEAFEDRERADKLLDRVHDAYFPNFPYERRISFFQRRMMENTRPMW